MVMDSDELRRLDRLQARRAKRAPTLEQQARAIVFLIFGLLGIGAPVLAVGWSALFWAGMGLAALFLLWCIYGLILIGVQAWDERGR